MGKTLIVVGGVAAGTSAASRARRIDPEMEIIIFEQGAFISYGACDEPYFIGGVVPSWENLLVRKPEVFRDKQNIDIRLRHRVTQVHPQQKSVTVVNLETGIEISHPYNKLILATGARPRPLDIPGSEARNLFNIKSLESTIALDLFIREQKPQNAVLIGAGFIVLEMAEALRARGLSVTILHRSDRPGSIFEPEISELIKQELEENGVAYVPKTMPVRFATNEKGLITAVETDNGSFPGDLVLGGLGVLPNVGIGVAAGVNTGSAGGFSVDDHMRTSLPDIFAAGDCVETINRISGIRHLYPLGDLANKQGWTAGENAAGGDITYPGALGSMHFKCFQLEVGATGIGVKEAQKAGFETFTNVISHRSRAHAQPASQKITVKLIIDRNRRKLLGAQIAGREGAALRINVLAMALHAGLTVDQLNAADLAYAPPFSPVIDPVLIAARDAVKKMGV